MGVYHHRFSKLMSTFSCHIPVKVCNNNYVRWLERDYASMYISGVQTIFTLGEQNF